MAQLSDAARSRGGVPTVGVEEEFFLADLATGRPAALGDLVVPGARALGGELHREITEVQVETNTPPCRSLSELREHLVATRSTAAEAALRHGAGLLPAGVAPLGPLAQPISDLPRYRRLGDTFGRLAAEHAICGCHVHVEVPDRETAVRVCNHLRRWLPVLLALTANSAVHDGVDTGYASWRSVLASRWHCSGAPPHFESVAHYDELVAMMIGTGSVLDEGMVYWDVRPSHHLPTVEVRVSDVPATVEETALLAALVRALVMTALDAVREGVDAEPVGAEALRMAYWRAACDGVTGVGVDLVTNRAVPVAELLRGLLRHVRPALARTGELRWVTGMVDEVLVRGNGAVRQRRALRASGSAADLVASLVEPGDRDRRPDNAA
ncbi:glutamate--cysteine ligase [Saccharothrix longispora]|uniref:Putative glutamate--cysteine ligase 2 n=1 Tax=Saccharothrix longispora TaxID=33920 RepID=A0ABU1PX57_9PSEU|nr:glutamate--cysteine ligase [Saccharothrix longispora]MDR6594853.1 carboxylate-amine ligase [Saccharothrix longispora]